MLDGQNQLMDANFDDTFHSVEFQHKNKKANIIKLNDELAKQKTEIAEKQSEVNNIVSELNVSRTHLCCIRKLISAKLLPVLVK